MLNLRDANGLVFWDEREIVQRDALVSLLYQAMRQVLLDMNPAFQFFRVEGPVLMPLAYLHSAYTNEDVFSVGEWVLRPETTKSSYEYADYLLNAHTRPKVRLPIVVWQHGKSCRNEQDKTVAHMRLKEFYQLEFQVIFSPDTKADYMPVIIEALKGCLSAMGLACRDEPSDRLPGYSQETTDLICEKNDMELASMSRRTDYANGKVIEVAIGTDRCVYCMKAQS